MEFTIVRDSASAAQLKKGFSVREAMEKSDFGVKDAENLGFTCDANSIKAAMAADENYKAYVTAMAKDAGFSLGDANIDAIGQFFLYINESTINALYRGRTAAQTFGVKMVGDWTTEKVAFKLRELVSGGTGKYDDFSRPGYANYNYGWDVRDTIRLEWGIKVTKLEEAVASVMRRNAYKDKFDSVSLTADIWLNGYFWYGTTAGSKKLYGVFTEPGLATRTTNLPHDTHWEASNMSGLTMDEVVDTLRIFKQNLATDLQGNGDVNTLPVTIAAPLEWQTAFTMINTYGLTANDWLSKNWPNATVEFKPELSGKFIVFAKNVPGVGMDTINLMQTSRLHMVGAMPTLKGREEAYSASVAGAFMACPVGMKVYEA